MPLARKPLRHHGFVAGAALVALFATASLLAPVLAPEDPQAVAAGGPTLQPPSRAHPLGTDALGRDVLSRVLWGGRVSLAVGVGVEALVVALGCAVGLLAGYFGGKVDATLMRVTDIVMAFPSLVLAIGLIAVFERPGLDKVFIVLVALGWTTIARVVRGEVLALKARDFVQAARALGGGHRAIMLRHLLPNAVAPLLVAATIGVGGNMVAEAGLSFLGLGAQSPTISWGAMLADGQTFLDIAPWAAVFPGAALLLAVLGVNLLGDGLRDLLDPRLRA
ncbi:MAG TPA: ABC transporter permease [Methylomirabilota bacterium]|jgi:peptide/nickel transport system permease protein|nr:ABC transporter permease [Methylomirabilota bacterium]